MDTPISQNHDSLAADRRSTRLRKWKGIGWIAVVAAALAVLIGYFTWWTPRQRARAEARKMDRSAAAALNAGNPEAAECAWMNAIAVWPGDADAYSALGDFYREYGQTDDALISYQQAIQVNPHYPHIYCRMAEAAAGSGNAPLEYRLARKELERDGRCIRAIDLLADLDDRNGEHEKASKEVEQAYRIDPSDEHTVALYAEMIMNGEPDRALGILTRALPQHPNSAEITFDLGWCSSRATGSAASVPKAMQELYQAEKLDPEMGVAYKELCRLLLQQNNLGDAVRQGVLSVQHLPYDPQCYLYLSQALNRTGRTAEAQKVLARFNALQVVQARQSVLNQAYSEKPGDPRIAHELAALDEQIGDQKDALTVLRVAFNTHPEDRQIAADLNRALNANATP